MPLIAKKKGAKEILTVAHTVVRTFLNLANILVEEAQVGEGGVVVLGEGAIGVVGGGLGPSGAVLVKSESTVGKAVGDANAVGALLNKAPAVFESTWVDADELFDGHVLGMFVNNAGASLMCCEIKSVKTQTEGKVQVGIATNIVGSHGVILDTTVFGVKRAVCQLFRSVYGAGGIAASRVLGAVVVTVAVVGALLEHALEGALVVSSAAGGKDGLCSSSQERESKDGSSEGAHVVSSELGS